MKKHIDNPLFSRRDLLLSGTATALSISVVSAPNTAQAAQSVGERRKSVRFDLDRFVDDCRVANRETARQAAIQQVLDRALADPAEVMAVIGEPETAGIQTLYRSDDLTILNIVWAPLMQLMPHEHKMWSAVGLYTGREDNIFWTRTSRSISADGALSLAAGETAGLPDDVIHSVVNPIQKLTGAIHIYGGDFFAVPRSEWDPATLKEDAWDIEKARRLFGESNERFTAWKAAKNCS